MQLPGVGVMQRIDGRCVTTSSTTLLIPSLLSLPPLYWCALVGFHLYPMSLGKGIGGQLVDNGSFDGMN
jgi:hypothetical protein